ncbi:MAG: hypothetical protein PVJ21_02425 [Anaerolineales bacterium]|jgi:DNA-binding response OmpR family regulator
MFVSKLTTPKKTVQIVLFILDQNNASEMWETAFQEKGFTTVREEPENALQTCRVVDPVLSVVNTDLTHDKCLSFCSQLRSVTSGLIFLLVPDYDGIKLKDIYDIGVDECLLKPVSPAFLVIKAASWLLRKRWLGQDAYLSKVYTHI